MPAKLKLIMWTKLLPSAMLATAAAVALLLLPTIAGATPTVTSTGPLTTAAVAADPFDSPSCNPMVCACVRAAVDGDEGTGGVTANCSGRGFLSAPVGLPADTVHLDLSSNDLREVNATGLLSALPRLRTLDLSGNRLSALSAGVHYNLERLYLSSNNLSSVRHLRLEGLVSLTDLDLSGNRIVSLPHGALAGSLTLRRLDLKGNRLVTLEPGSLDEMTALEELVLTRNRLSSFPKGLFRNMKNLQVLELNRNRFVEIQGLSFHGLDSLRVLRLRRNDIEYLMDGAFFGLINIEELSLDRNRVREVTKGWLYGLRTLTRLGLSHNAVEYVAEDGWEFCGALADLDMSHNRLQVLDRDTLRMLPGLRRLDLSDNAISHVETEGGDGEDTFAEVAGLEELVLDDNELSHTVEDTAAPFSSLSALRLLSLSRNSIKSVGDRALEGLSSLEELRLAGNVVSTLQQGAFDDAPLLRTLDLDSASLLCDCHLRWLPEWRNATGARAVGDAGTCAHPESLRGRPVWSVESGDFTCDDFPKPYIQRHPQTQMSLVGADLVLGCRAASTSPAEMTFRWRKVGGSVAAALGEREEFPACPADDDDGGERDLRCVRTVEHTLDGDKGREVTSELVMSNLTGEDAGTYQCVVSNAFGATYSDRADVTVYVYPEFLVTPEDITVRGGATAALKCAARGVPAPNVTWSKDSGSDFPAARERRIALSNFGDVSDPTASINSFVIYGVKADDMGSYRCTASNPAGSISWNITLSVLEAPRFVKPMEATKSASPGETAVLECLASGSPRPRLTWKKDGAELVPTERHFFTADNQLLIIVKVGEGDAGRYECSMHNQLGTVSQSSNLAVVAGGGPAGPVPPGGRRASNSSSDDTANLGGSAGAEADDDDEGSGTLLMLLVAGAVSCVVVLVLVLLVVCCRLRSRSRRRRQEQLHSVSDGRVIIQPGLNRGGKQRSALPVSATAGGGEVFDIHEHVRRNLLSPAASSNPMTTSTYITAGQTETSLGSTGLLTTDLKHLDNSDEERDSGTGDSKKSNELAAMEDSDDGTGGDFVTRYASEPRRRAVENGNGDVRTSLLHEDEEEEEEEGGAGESRISLSEFDSAAPLATAEEDVDGSVVAASTSTSSSSRMPNSTLTNGDDEEEDPLLMQGGGEGRFTNSSECSSSRNPRPRLRQGQNQHPSPSQKEPPPHSPEPEVQFKTFGRQPSQADGLNGGGLGGRTGIKRSSTVELDGKCYMQIERPPLTEAASPRWPTASSSTVDLTEAARVYRGGVGSLPRGASWRSPQALQQEMLEASINSASSEYRLESELMEEERQKRRRERRRSKNNRSSSSSSGLFRRSLSVGRGGLGSRPSEDSVAKRRAGRTDVTGKDREYF